MPQRRTVVKVGSNCITDQTGQVSVQAMGPLVEEMARARGDGAQIVLVSSGAVAAGLGRLGWQRGHVTLPEKQAAAAVGQGLLVGTYEGLFSRFDIPIAQLLLTRADIEDRRRFVHIRNTLEALLKNGILPIVNENDTVTAEEIRVGDNDTLSAFVALAADAELLVLLTDTDGLYTGDPKTDPTAQRLDDVWEITDEIRAFAGNQKTAFGTGGMRTKLKAARIAVSAGVDVVITSSRDPALLARALNGSPVGTKFHRRAVPSARRKKLWIAHGTRAEGRIVVDEGAAQALLSKAVSLLLPGIVELEGGFLEGSIVEITDPAGHVVGKGAVNVSSSDLALLLERRRQGDRTRQAAEIVHRDEMVIFKGGEPA